MWKIFLFSAFSKLRLYLQRAPKLVNCHGTLQNIVASCSFSVHPVHLRQLQLVVHRVSSILEDNDSQHPVQIVQVLWMYLQSTSEYTQRTEEIGEC